MPRGKSPSHPKLLGRPPGSAFAPGRGRGLEGLMQVSVACCGPRLAPYIFPSSSPLARCPPLPAPTVCLAGAAPRAVPAAGGDPGRLDTGDVLTEGELRVR